MRLFCWLANPDVRYKSWKSVDPLPSQKELLRLLWQFHWTTIISLGMVAGKSSSNAQFTLSPPLFWWFWPKRPDSFVWGIWRSLTWCPFKDRSQYRLFKVIYPVVFYILAGKLQNMVFNSLGAIFDRNKKKNYLQLLDLLKLETYFLLLHMNFQGNSIFRRGWLKLYLLWSLNFVSPFSAKEYPAAMS